MGSSVFVKCAGCGRVYSLPRSLTAEYRGRSNNYCSNECYQASKPKKVQVQCAVCQKKFEVWPSRFNRGNVQYCSKKCAEVEKSQRMLVASAHLRTRREVPCQECGKPVELTPSRIKNNARFCSSRCYGAWREREGISRGSNNPQYRDGSTMRTLHRLRRAEWRRIADAVRAERGNNCECCGKRGRVRKLPVHHIIPWEVSRDDNPDNLMVVCQSCHVRLDTAYFKHGLVLAQDGSFVPAPTVAL